MLYWAFFLIDINLIFVASYLSKIFVDTYLNKRLCGATTLIILKILTSSQNIPLARPSFVRLVFPVAVGQPHREQISN